MFLIRLTWSALVTGHVRFPSILVRDRVCTYYNGMYVRISDQPVVRQGAVLHNNKTKYSYP